MDGFSVDYNEGEGMVWNIYEVESAFCRKRNFKNTKNALCLGGLRNFVIVERSFTVYV